MNTHKAKCHRLHSTLPPPPPPFWNINSYNSYHLFSEVKRAMPKASTHNWRVSCISIDKLGNLNSRNTLVRFYFWFSPNLNFYQWRHQTQIRSDPSTHGHKQLNELKIYSYKNLDQNRNSDSFSSICNISAFETVTNRFHLSFCHSSLEVIHLPLDECQRPASNKEIMSCQTELII